MNEHGTQVDYSTAYFGVIKRAKAVASRDIKNVDQPEQRERHSLTQQD